MPWLNCVFEELGIHHEEHKVPAKVLKYIEDKAKNAIAKNNTAAAESKKRRGTSTVKASARSGRLGLLSLVLLQRPLRKSRRVIMGALLLRLLAWRAIIPQPPLTLEG
jgi:hypothetical protein